MQSSRAYSSAYVKDERLRAWKGDRRPDFEAMERGDVRAMVSVMTRDIVDLSEQARAAAKEALAKDALTSAGGAGETQDAIGSALSPEDDAKVQMVEMLFERLTGHKLKIKFLRPEDMGTDKQAREAAEALQDAAGKLQAARSGNGSQGWGVEYDRVEHRQETETTTFSADGVVKTADGKEIAVSVTLSMSREFIQQNDLHVRAGDAVRKDPLVVNFSGTAAQLTTDRFSFDLDADGKPDRISFVAPGSGFLAVDNNADGKVNDGSELFGPRSGNGFAELAAHDGDGNHWIDEADPIYDRLRVWTKDAQGNDHLLALGQVGVGAIYLGSVSTRFSVNDPSNNQLGQVESTGIWLGQTAGSGVIQHTDLVV